MTPLRTWPALAVGLAVVAAAAGDDRSRTVNFAKADLGKVPAGWTAARTGKGEGSVWKVVEDSTAPSKTGYALAQTAESPKAMFNLCVAEDTSFKDVEITVAFKANHGVNDQGGGLVWRYQDADNYYVARMNPLEDNYRLYYVTKGQRMQFAGKEGLKIKEGEWHTLSVKMIGTAITCSLDGKVEVEGKDDTIAKPGKVGLWTKADARTSFAGFTVKPAGK
jgi:hypothetical protein